MKRISLIVIFTITGYLGMAQPCMDLWRFRTPITIDNTTNPNPLVDHQVKFTLDTDSLISNGELKADASDLRFTNSAGVLLPFWIVNSTLNTNATEVWVNIDNIPPNSSINIYMFYGNIMANSVIDGDATFLHYDNFDGTALDFGKWTFCGGASGGTIPVVSNGEITFASSSGQYSHMIKSLQTFSDTITTEMFVNSFNEGPVIIGNTVSSDNGYAMVLQDQATVDNMRLVSIDATTGADSCLSLVNQTPVNSVTAGSVQGLWSFTWRKPNEQLFSWPSGNETRNSYIDSSYFNQNKNIVLGSFYNTSSVSVDYIYTRKYTSIPPTYSYGNRTDLVDIVEVSTNAPVCVGDSLKLFAPFFNGAVYSWIGPNGFTSSNQNPVISTSSFTNVGQYILTVSAPTGCSVVSDSIWVNLDSIPVAGNLISDTTVCYGQGQGDLILTNTTGNVIYWQSSSTTGGPWNTITETTKSLNYNNLLSTTYYRAIVEYGACGLDTSNYASIIVDALSDGGNISGGNTEVCYGHNHGYLTSSDYVGDIIKWQSSIDSGATWLDISTTNNEIQYSNITDTTWYRMLVKNNVCDSSFSDTAKIFVHPLPVVDFSSDSICLNNNTSFNNLSSISNGTINNYNWNFTDGGSASIIHPVHKFNNHGTFNVYLKAVSDKGCVDSIRKDVIVHPNPVSEFSFTDVCDTSEASFTNLSTIATGNINTNIWTYNDTLAPDTIQNGFYTYPSFGDYDVYLTSISDYGCSDTITKTIRVLQRAIVDFVPDSVCLKEDILFSNTTQTYNDSTIYSWNFGDGNFSSEENPNYKYSNHGTYQVVLQATTFGKCVNTKVDTVVIYPLPHADFTFINQCQYDSVKFINLSNIYSGNFSSFWKFGDSTTSNSDSVNHFYNAAGNYFVSLFTESNFGCKDDTTLMTEVYPIPKANFVVEDVCRDTITPITNTSSIISGSYSSFWEFGNGDTSIVEDPIYTYPNDGTFNLKLTITSNHNCIDTIVRDAIVHPIPKTNFVFDSVCKGVETSFLNTTTINKGFINGYLWNFDNQLSSIDVNPTHLFGFDGIYNVNLRAVSNKGCQKDTSIPVIVYAVPELDYNYDNACVFNPVIFNNNSSVNTGFQTYFWQFGNDSTSILHSPEHIYQLHGIYPVQLTATTNNACTDSLTKLIEIYPLPLIDAGSDTTLSYGFNVQLNGIAPTAVNVIWTPSLTVLNYDEVITEARPLENTIFNLEVTDEYGCVNNDNVFVEVIKDYKLKVSNVITPNGDGKNDTWKVFNANLYDDIDIRIYDMWGYEVFQANDYSSEWNGVVHLDELVEGTYYYAITFSGSEKIYKGSITILK